MTDVLIIGAGIMGCASALALASRGVRTRVLERSVPGAEASSAAAGILGAQVESHADGPMLRLCLASRARFASLARELSERTGIDVGYRPTGVTRVAFDLEALQTAREIASWQAAAGLRVEYLGARAVRDAEPAVASTALGGVHFADDARIDPPSLLNALRIAAEGAGALFSSGSYVSRVDVELGRARGVVMENGERLSASHVVLAAGSWSPLVAHSSLDERAIVPARGQIVELLATSPILRGVVFGPGCYLSPRDDGRVLVGSTLEFVGFRRGVTAQAVHALVGAAMHLVPALGEAQLGRTWSSFRPYTEDERPLIGPTDVEGLILATGHHRNGILLSAITAEIVASCIAGEALPVDIAPFSSARLQRGSADPARNASQ